MLCCLLSQVIGSTAQPTRPGQWFATSTTGKMINAKPLRVFWTSGCWCVDASLISRFIRAIDYCRMIAEFGVSPVCTICDLLGNCDLQVARQPPSLCAIELCRIEIPALHLPKIIADFCRDSGLKGLKRK